MSRVDDILDVIEVGLQTSWETGYGTDHWPDRCARCLDSPPVDGGDLCIGCRAFMLGDSHADPSATLDDPPTGRRAYDAVRPGRPEALRCFGGPRDGEMLRLRDGSDVVLVPVPMTITWSIDINPDPMTTLETVRYVVEQFPMTITWSIDINPDPMTTLETPPVGHTERCHTISHCLVAEGHDRQRIVDHINALTKLTAALSSGRWMD